MSVDVTILMPVYNAGKYLPDAIGSILNQTFRDFELLIVNDGSTDNSVEIIHSYKDPRIRLLSQENQGVSAALNTGLAQAQGKYIARFDADDICMPDRIRLQYRFMEEHPDYILIGSDVDYVTEEGEYIFTFTNKGHSDEEIKAMALESCPFVHSSVMYVKQTVMALGGYDEKAHTFEDYFLWLKLINRGKVCNFPQSLIKVRFNASSVTIDERDHEPLFRQLKLKALQTGVITENEGEQILGALKRLNPEKKLASYNRMLGKKYLWNNYQPARARRHLRQAIRLEPQKFKSYLLFLLSYFPKRAIEAIYSQKRVQTVE